MKARLVKALERVFKKTDKMKNTRKRKIEGVLEAACRFSGRVSMRDLRNELQHRRLSLKDINQIMAETRGPKKSSRRAVRPSAASMTEDVHAHHADVNSGLSATAPTRHDDLVSENLDPYEEPAPAGHGDESPGPQRLRDAGQVEPPWAASAETVESDGASVTEQATQSESQRESAFPLPAALDGNGVHDNGGIEDAAHR